MRVFIEDFPIPVLAMGVQTNVFCGILKFYDKKQRNIKNPQSSCKVDLSKC